MNPERWQLVNRLFDECVELSPSLRPAYLRQVCGDDRELLSELETLLDHSATEQHWAHSAVGELAAEMAGSGELTGSRIGPYVLTRIIGRGGMGVVYEGERADGQVRMKAAIKMIQPGMNTGLLLRRFLEERQILASLDHPNIARLLDAGLTADRQPYLAMEFVDGEPLKEYCDRKGLCLPDRIRLFLSICDAVGHAHRHLVVHCDLKPANVLVTAEGIPKLLDFGVARLLSRESGPEQTVETIATGLLTPAYASPEQILGERVTTASDVYSLGVILYELLTWQRPHETADLPLSAIQRRVCEEDAPRPSIAVLRGEALPENSRRQHARQLKGDLDNILLRALEREPARRYVSPSHLADDLRAYLEGRTVSAAPAGAAYRLRKLILRHKAVTAATAAALITLAGGVFAVAHQARRTEHRFQQVRRLANVFLFDFHDKIQDLAGSTAAREMVIRTGLDYLESLEKDAQSDQPLAREVAEGYIRLGLLQSRLGSSSLADARKSAEKALVILERLRSRGADDFQTRRTLSSASDLLGFLSFQSGDTAASIRYYEQAETLIPSLLAARPDDQELLRQQADIALMLAQGLERQGKLPESADRARNANEALVRLTAIDKSAIFRDMLAASHTTLANALIRMGLFDEAVIHDRKGVEIREQRLAEDPRNARTMRQLLIAYSGLGDDLTDMLAPRQDIPAALVYYQKMLALAEQLMRLDPADRDVMVDGVHAYSRTGGALADLGRHVEALPVLLKARGLADSLLEADPAMFGLRLRASRVEEQLASLFHALDRGPDALAASRRSLAHASVLVGRDGRHAGALRQRLMSGRTHVGLLAAYSNASETSRFAAELLEWASSTGARTDRTLLLQVPYTHAAVATAHETLARRFPSGPHAAAACDHWLSCAERWQQLNASGIRLAAVDTGLADARRRIALCANGKK